MNRRRGGPRAGLGALEKRKVNSEQGGNHVYHLLQLQNDSSLLNHCLCMLYLTVNMNRVFLGKVRALTDSYIVSEKHCIFCEAMMEILNKLLFIFGTVG